MRHELERLDKTAAYIEDWRRRNPSRTPRPAPQPRVCSSRVPYSAPAEPLKECPLLQRLIAHRIKYLASRPGSFFPLAALPAKWPLLALAAHQNLRRPAVSRCSRLHKDQVQGSSAAASANYPADPFVEREICSRLTDRNAWNFPPNSLEAIDGHR
jgi:hypothetical protein